MPFTSGEKPAVLQPEAAFNGSSTSIFWTCAHHDLAQVRATQTVASEPDAPEVVGLASPPHPGYCR
jgi:hypothetical protein